MGDSFSDTGVDPSNDPCPDCKKEKRAWLWDYFHCVKCGYKARKKSKKSAPSSNG